MSKFIIKRLLYLVPLLFGVSLFIFLLLRLSGTDATISYLNASGIAPTDDAISEARIALGLDKPIVQQYIIWKKRLLHLILVALLSPVEMYFMI